MNLVVNNVSSIIAMLHIIHLNKVLLITTLYCMSVNSVVSYQCVSEKFIVGIYFLLPTSVQNLRKLSVSLRSSVVFSVGH